MYEPHYEEETGGGGFLIGLLCGTALGAAIGLMFAPKAGSEFRQRLYESTGDIRRKAYRDLRSGQRTGQQYGQQGTSGRRARAGGIRKCAAVGRGPNSGGQRTRLGVRHDRPVLGSPTSILARARLAAPSTCFVKSKEQRATSRESEQSVKLLFLSPRKLSPLPSRPIQLVHVSQVYGISRAFWAFVCLDQCLK